MLAHDFPPGFAPKSIVLFDLDNCLSDDGWRIPYIRRDTDNLSLKWVAYHDACDRDRPANLGSFQRELMEEGSWPVFVTARPGEVAAKTVNWIHRHLLQLASDKFMLIMRDSHDDHRPSLDIKRNAAHFLLARFPGAVRAAYDDRPDICVMYTALGIPATQLKVHDDIQHEHMPDAPPSRGTVNIVNRTSERLSQRDADDLARCVCDRFHVKPPPPRDKTAFDFLQEGAQVYRERNETYANGYHAFGPVAAALFPKGLTVSSPEEWNRLAVFVWVMTKVQRYAGAFSDGGHADSALDLSVYAAMLRELTVNNKETTS